MDDLGPKLTKHRVYCRNKGCKGTDVQHLWPGDKPKPFVCSNCKTRGNGLGAGTYPDHGTNADALSETQT